LVLTPQDLVFMTRAIRLAKRGLYTTEPNPRVGCVVVKGDDVVAEGWHGKAGQQHAEIMALNTAGEAAKGATVYVTLEPCCHQGRTPPCSEALISAEVARVVIAGIDPNGLVAGQGAEQLQAAGIDVDIIEGLLAEEAMALNPGFFQRMQSNRPYVRIKMATSLDGKTAMASAESQWISGEAARYDVQLLRARSSCILTGINTVLEDDPRLNVRLQPSDVGVSLALNQPLIAVLDSQLRLPAECQLLQVNDRVVVFTSMNTDAAKVKRLQNQGVTVIKVKSSEQGLDLHQVMSELARLEVNEIHVEAGATLCGALLQAALADELVLYMAPHLMGMDGRGAFNLPMVKNMGDRIQLSICDTRVIGNDLRITAKPIYSH